MTRVESNFVKRYHLIIHFINTDIENAGRGISVVEGLRRFRLLSSAIGQHIGSYTQDVLPNGGRGLVTLLLNMLAWIADRDQDLYANARVPRAQYAGGGNTGNMFREFVREHVGIMDEVTRLPAALLRERRDAFVAIIQTIRANGPSNGDRAQFQRLVGELQRNFDRESPTPSLHQAVTPLIHSQASVMSELCTTSV